MAIRIGQRRVAPQATTQPTQPTGTQAAAPAIEALDLVGKTVSRLGEIGVQGQILDQKQQEKIAALAEKEQENQDKADATEAVTLSKGAINEKMAEYKTRQQRNAKGVTVEYDAFFKELSSKGLEGLSTDRSKQLYVEDMVAVGINSHVTAVTHERQETVKSQKAAASSSANISVQSGIENFDNPNTHIIEQDNIEEQANSLAELNGWSMDEKLEYQSEKISNMYEGIVRQWAIKDAETAKLSYDANKDNILGDKRDDIETLIKVEDTNQKAFDSANEAMLQGETTKESLDWIDDNVTDADVNQKAKANVRTMRKDEQDSLIRDRRIYLDNVTGQVSDMFRAGDTRSMADRLADGIENGKDRAEMRSNINSLWNDKNKTKETNFAKMTELNERIRRGEVTSDMQIDLEYGRFLSNQQNKEAKSFLSGGGNAGKVNYNSVKQSWLRFADKSRFDTSDNDDMEQFGAVYQYVLNQSNTIAGDPTGARIDQWVAEGLAKVKAPGETFLGIEFGEEETTRAEAIQRDLEVITIVPDDRVEPIEKALKELGYPATEQNIRDYYDEVDSQ